MKSALNYDTILVTGGAGFIGSHTVDGLLRGQQLRDPSSFIL